MSRLPWDKFYWQDWYSDGRLRRARASSRGIWMDLLAVMVRDNTYYLTMTREEFSRIAFCTLEEFELFIDDGKETRFCDVTLSNNKVTVKSRRLSRKHDRRKQVAKRVKKHRSKKKSDDVTPAKQTEVEVEVEVEIEEPKDSAALLKELDPIMAEVQLLFPAFNPYSYMTRKMNKQRRPLECWIDLFTRMVREKDKIENPWGWCEKVFAIEAGNVEASMAEAKHEELKEFDISNIIKNIPEDPEADHGQD